MNKFYQILNSNSNLFSTFLLILLSLNLNGQSVQNRNWVDSEVNYTDSKRNTITVTNSLPKGGGVVDKNGEKYGYRVFWTRIRNKSATPTEIKLKFPDVTFFKPPESYIKIVLPKESMNIKKEQLFDYGLTNLQSLLNDKSNQLSILKKKIGPKEDYFFYVTVFIHLDGSGSARAKFELKDKELFYKISIGSYTTLIPCGNLDFKN
ncbi:MAG: hypothetical protein RL308_1724 [Bacteroidota bacterium]